MMTDDTYDDAGELFHTIRNRRGLTIRQVHGNLHKTAVSHFENNGSDIRMNNLMTILKPTYTMPQEFFELIDHTNNRLRALSIEISNAHQQMDTVMLSQLADRYANAKKDNPPRYLLKLVIKNFLSDLKHQQSVLSGEEEDYLQDYLLKDGPWFFFEYYIYSSVCFSLSKQVNDRLMRQMLKQYGAFHLNSYDELFFGAFYNLSTKYLQRGDYQEALTMLNLVDMDKLNANVLYMRHHIAFVRLATAILTNNGAKKAREELSLLLKGTKIIAPTLYAVNINWLESLHIDPKSLDLERE